MDMCVTRPPDVLVNPGHHALCWLYADGDKTGPVAAKTVAG